MISINHAEDWLEANEGDPGHGKYTEEQIADNVSAAEAGDEEENRKLQQCHP